MEFKHGVCEARQKGWNLKMKSRLRRKVCELRRGVEFEDEVWIETEGCELRHGG